MLKSLLSTGLTQEACPNINEEMLTGMLGIKRIKSNKQTIRKIGKFKH